MLANQHQVACGHQSQSSGLFINCCRQQLQCNALWRKLKGPLLLAVGYMYMAIVGCLLLSESLLLAPSPMSPMYVMLAMAVLKHDAIKLSSFFWRAPAGSTLESFILSRNTYFFKNNDLYWNMLLLQDRLGTGEIRHFIRGAQWSTLFWLYPCAVIGFMLMFFGNVLPVTRSKRWSPVLLLTQITLFAATSWLPWLFDRNFLGYMFLSLGSWFVSWFGMFLLWPLLHRSQPRNVPAAAAAAVAPVAAVLSALECARETAAVNASMQLVDIRCAAYLKLSANRA